MRGQDSHGEAIRDLRRKRGWTQELLSQRAGCDIKTVRKAERGLRLDLASLRVLAEALEVPLSAVTAPRTAPPHSSPLATEWLEAFRERDLSRLLACYGPRATLSCAAPGFPGAGMHRGKQGLRRHWAQVWAAIDLHGLASEETRVYSAPGHILMRTSWLVPRANTAPHRLEGVHELRLARSRIADQWSLLETSTWGGCDEAQKSP